MTDAAARATLPEEEDVTAADRLIVESPTATGLIVVRALSPEPGLMPMAQASLAGRAVPHAVRGSARNLHSPPPRKSGLPDLRIIDAELGQARVRSRSE